MKYTSLFFILLLLSSCATIMNQKEQKLYFYSDTNNELLQFKDSTYALPAEISVVRAREDLSVTLLSDSIPKEYTLLADVAPIVYWQGVFNPLGLLVDFTNDKRFFYQEQNYFGANMDSNYLGSKAVIYNRQSKLQRSLHSAKGDAFLYFTYAPLNYLSFDLPEFESTKTGLGTWLGDFGAVYYYADHRFLKLGVGVNASAHIVPVEYHPMLVSYSVQLANFHDLQHFNLGYGLFAAHHSYRREVETEFLSQEQTILKGHQNTIGVVLSAHYKLSNTFSIGLNYQSSVYRLSSPSEFSSNHVVGVELTQRIRLSKKRTKSD